MSEFGKVFTRNDMLRHHFSKHKFLRDIKRFKVGELVEIFLDADLISDITTGMIVTLKSVRNMSPYFYNRHHQSHHQDKCSCKCSAHGNKVWVINFKLF